MLTPAWRSGGEKGSSSDLFGLEQERKLPLTRFILIEDVIRSNMDLLFPGMIVEGERRRQAT